MKNFKFSRRSFLKAGAAASVASLVAANAAAASELSRQIREDQFQKEYLAVIHGVPQQRSGTWEDLLYRDKARRMTFVTQTPGKGVQPAVLDYQVLGQKDGLSRVAVHLHTGRTHQIRVQFSSRGYPLVGERKYAVLEDPCEIALWSHRIGFAHPASGAWVEFSQEPPDQYPWNAVP